MKNHTHIGVYGIIINDDKVLLITKSRGAYTGKLDFPGGSFEHGETPEETLIREIKEETNLDVKSYHLYDVKSVRLTWQKNEEMEDLHHIGIFYLVECQDGNIRTDYDGYDSLGASWIAIKDLKIENISPFVKSIMPELGYDIVL